MKRFKQWLLENPEIISNTFTDFNDIEQYPIRRKEITKKIKSLRHISTMSNGIKVYHKRYKYPGDPYESEQEFHAFDNKKNKFVARVSILTHPNGQHKVTNAEKHPYSDLEMGDLYRHITKKHLGNLNSDTQHSIGSVKNWENITNKPGKGFKVTKHEYDSEDGTLSKEVPMKRGKEFRKNYTGKNRFHTFFRLSYRGKIANSLKEFKQWLEEAAPSIKINNKIVDFLWHLTSPIDQRYHQLNEITLYDNKPKSARMVSIGQQNQTKGENLHKRVHQGFTKALDEMETEDQATRRAKIRESRKVASDFAKSYGMGSHPDILGGRNSKIKASPDLLGSNTKLKKGATHISILGISLAPHETSGLNNYNICPKASTHCAANCLGLTAGGAKQFPDHALSSKIMKTHFMTQYPEHFARLLDHEIRLHSRKTQREGGIPAIRLNVTSDIPFEKYKSSSGKSIIDRHSNTQFYDYTKLANRVGHPDTPKNYHLTLSSTGSNHSESNDSDVAKKLEDGHTVAMVIKKKSVPATHVEDMKTGKRYPIINGDNDDFTPGRHEEAGLIRGKKGHGVVSSLTLKGVKNDAADVFAHDVHPDGIVRINNK